MDHSLPQVNSMCRHLSPRYSYVILVSGYPVLTAVNWRKFRLQATTLARNQRVSFHIVSLWYGRTDSRADVLLRVFQISLAMGLRYDFFYPIFYDFNFPPSPLKIQPKCLLHWSQVACTAEMLFLGFPRYFLTESSWTSSGDIEVEYEGNFPYTPPLTYLLVT